jgi:pimeloyl-ACP methyl ester carboxylesterase
MCSRYEPIAAAILILSSAARAASLSSEAASLPFDGEKTVWHSFDRYDFLLDEQRLTIQPTKAASDEGDGIKHQVKGQRRCIVVVPKTVASGNPWSWRGCYWDHQPQTEIELLRRGFHIAYIESSQELKPDRSWDAWYEFLTVKHALSAKPTFAGMSRGGEYAYTWATAHPDKVACIYADNPGGNWDVLTRLGALATNNVPLLHVCGSIDPILGKFTLPMENIYHAFGGRISVMIKEGRGHHPHSLRDPKPIADFIEQSVKETKATLPDWVGARFSRSAYYSVTTAYRNYPSEGTYISVRGPQFTECYTRYQIVLPEVEAFTTILEPKISAPGKPWMFRADWVERDAVVEQALLAKGFHIVTGAVPYNGDGPLPAQWNAIYNYLVAHGFSPKPVMAGAGGAAGEAYAWAIANPDKVSCIYAENAFLRSNTAQVQPLDDLAPLAKAGVPILHVCGSEDPWLESQTRVLEKRYAELGGKITVLVQKGQGHYPLSPKDPQQAVDFITRNAFNTGKKLGLAPLKSPSPSLVNYGFDHRISRGVLENYLSRAITIEGLVNGHGDLNDNIRMLKRIGAKYLGRALCLWGAENNFLSNIERARQQIPQVLAADPHMIVEGCVFETVSPKVNDIEVPGWVFTALGQPVEKRNFRFDDIIYPEGQRRPMGRNAQVPDVSRTETQLWFYYQAASYIAAGCEAIHFGQVEIMNKNDRDNAQWERLLTLVRAYAAQHARRHMVLCNGHVPSGGLMRNGRPLLDFNAFPLRIMETPEKPKEAILKVGFSDGIYGRSKGGQTFSGWSCEHLPYLVEFDNYGVSRHPGEPNAKGEFNWVWGYDEITWFAHQSKEYRAGWLQYAWDWVRNTDTNAFLEMPGSRTARSPDTQWYFANDPGPTVPTGMGDEEAIRKVWLASASRTGRADQ